MGVKKIRWRLIDPATKELYFQFAIGTRQFTMHMIQIQDRESPDHGKFRMWVDLPRGIDPDQIPIPAPNNNLELAKRYFQRAMSYFLSQPDAREKKGQPGTRIVHWDTDLNPQEKKEESDNELHFK